MASQNFTNLSDHLAKAAINFSTASFKALLTTTIPTEGNFDTWVNRSDVTNEHGATGNYVTGGFAVTAVVGALDTTNNRTPVTFSASNPVFTTSTISSVGAIVYLDTALATTDKLVGFTDFGGTVSSTNGDYNVTFSTPLYINA